MSMSRCFRFCLIVIFFSLNFEIWAETPFVNNSEKTTRITNTEESVVLSGFYPNGVIIDSDRDFVLVLDNVSIKSETCALEIKGNISNTVVFIKGWNDIEVEKTDKESKKGALECCPENCVCDIVFAGNGTLNINTSAKHGIHGQSIIFKEGYININLSESSTGHAIKAEDQVLVDGSEITINAMGSVSQEESKGIVVVGHESGTKVRPNPQDALCRFVMNKGTLNITSVSKAITAKWEKADGKTETTEDDPEAVVIVNGGNIIIKTTGLLNKTKENKLTPEGIEGKDRVIINGGFIDVLSTDDAINGKYIEINDGIVIAQSLMDDGIDSNGNISINGGVIVAMSDKDPAEPIDCNSGKNLTWTAGDIIAIGGVIESLPAWKGLGLGYFQIQRNLSLFQPNTLYLIDSDDNAILSFNIPERFKDYLHLDIFAGSDKTKGSCKLVFTIEEQQ